jgi:hypothetical protein
MRKASLMLLATLLISSCRLMVSTIPDPVENTRQALFRDHPTATRIQVLGSRRSPQGEVAVIYTLTEPSDGGRPMFFTGASVYQPAPTGGWQLTSGGGGGSSDPPEKDQLLDYFSMGGNGPTIYGRVVSSQVASVEARLSNGETYQDPADDGAFAIFATQGVKICSLAALDASGNILERNDFTSDQQEDPCH